MNNYEIIKSRLATLEAIAEAYQVTYMGGPLKKEESERAEYLLYHFFDLLTEARKEAEAMAEAEARETAQRLATA